MLNAGQPVAAHNEQRPVRSVIQAHRFLSVTRVHVFFSSYFKHKHMPHPDSRLARPMIAFKRGTVIVVSDRMQTGYTYTLAEDPGTNLGADPPDLTPLQALRLGIVDGCYFRDTVSEFPRPWFSAGRFSALPGRDVSCNYFGVSSRQSLQVWRDKGWIIPNSPDVRGWLQFYFRYWLGRRDRDPEADALQLRRQRAIIRHRGAVVKACTHAKVERYVPELGRMVTMCSDIMNCRPRQRQTLLNWCWNPFF